MQLMSMTHDQKTRSEILRLILLTNAIVFENLRGDTLVEGTGNAHFHFEDHTGVVKVSEAEMELLDQTNVSA